MEYSQRNVETVLTSTTLIAPSRPPHPNPALTPEILAPLIREQAKEALKEMEELMVSSTLQPVMIATVIQGAHSQTVGTDREEQQAKRTIQLKMISQLEIANAVATSLASAGSADTLQIWQRTIYPMIEQMLDFSKVGESQTTDAIKRLRGQFANLTETLADLIGAGSEEEDGPSEHQAVPDMMEKIASFAADSTRQHRRQERNVLSALLYDPHSQFEECRLNELAISMKQRDFEIDMDQRDPVVGVGDDDTKLLCIFAGNKLKEWARTMSERLVADLIDPISGLTITDQETLLNHCAAIQASQIVCFSVNGTESLDFSLTVPSGVPLSTTEISEEIRGLLAPIEAFERAMGFGHSIEGEHTPGGMKVTLKILLPSVESRFEPQSFHLKERALERLADIDIAQRLKELRDPASAEDGPSFATAESQFEPQERENVLLKASGNLSIFIQGSLFDDLSPEVTLNLMRLAMQIAQHQPASRFISLRKPDGVPFFNQQSGKQKIVFQLDGNPSDLASPLSRAREALEKQRAAFTPPNPMEQLMAAKGAGQYTIIRGTLLIDDIPTVTERLEQLPDWVQCVETRLKFLTLKETDFNLLMATIQEIRDNYKTESIYLTERPTSAFSHNAGRSLCFVIYSNTELPLAQIDLDTAQSQVSISHFDSALLEEFRSRALSALANPVEGNLRRIREVDELLMKAGLDLSLPLVQELTALSNSWAGRDLPVLRISDIMDKYLFDAAYLIDREGDTIRCLHLSERLAGKASPTLNSGNAQFLPN